MKKLKVILLKDRKFQLLSNFRCQDIPQNRLHSEIMYPPPTTLPFLSYSDVIKVKMFVLKHWVFLEDIWNFNKWKLLIIDEKCYMLMKAMLMETINVFLYVNLYSKRFLYVTSGKSDF